MSLKWNTEPLYRRDKCSMCEQPLRAQHPVLRADQATRTGLKPFVGTCGRAFHVQENSKTTT